MGVVCYCYGWVVLGLGFICVVGGVVDSFGSMLCCYYYSNIYIYTSYTITLAPIQLYKYKYTKILLLLLKITILSWLSNEHFLLLHRIHTQTITINISVKVNKLGQVYTNSCFGSQRVILFLALVYYCYASPHVLWRGGGWRWIGVFWGRFLCFIARVYVCVCVVVVSLALC